ncbi:MAG: hypothetical protein KKF44_11770 [Nanoarchaeota archaeon]|nr:hypothetical protein [Nanoarchaeota archaeon]
MKIWMFFLSILIVLTIVSCSSFPETLPENRFVFSMDNGKGNIDIYTMDIDTGSVGRLTTNRKKDWKPSISPDGKSIVFESERKGESEIYIMGADGLNEKRLTKNDYPDVTPSFSSDSSRIVYISYQDDGSHLKILDIASGEIQDIFTTKSLNLPSFVLDDEYVLYSGESEKSDYNIYLYHLESETGQAITTEKSTDWKPILSKDGNQILYISDRDGTHELYLQNVVDSSVRKVAEYLIQGNIVRAAFSSDGKEIIFMGFDQLEAESGKEELYMVGVDGSNFQQITNNDVMDELGTFPFPMNYETVLASDIQQCQEKSDSVCRGIDLSLEKDCRPYEELCTAIFPQCCYQCSASSEISESTFLTKYDYDEYSELIPDIIIGQPDYLHTTSNTIVPNKAYYPGGVIVDTNDKSTPDYVYVMDSENNRILGFDHLGYCLKRSDAPIINTYSAEYADYLRIENIFDGEKGACNQGEYAALSNAKKIELDLKIKEDTDLIGMFLYDRACFGYIAKILLTFEYEDGSIERVGPLDTKKMISEDLYLDFDKGTTPVYFNFNKMKTKDKKITRLILESESINSEEDPKGDFAAGIGEIEFISNGKGCTIVSDCGTGNKCIMDPEIYPTIVIGQDDRFDSGLSNNDNRKSMNPTKKTLSFIPYPDVISLTESPRSIQMALDSDGNLYVPDLNNNRVLRFNSPFETKKDLPGSGDTTADAVWGQESFDTKENSELKLDWSANVFQAGAYIFEKDGRKELWVTDTGYDGIMRYPFDEELGDISKTSDLKITQCTDEKGDIKLNRPNSILVDMDYNVFVLDNNEESRLIKISGIKEPKYADEDECPNDDDNEGECKEDDEQEISCEVFMQSEDIEKGLLWARGMNFHPYNQRHIWVMDGGHHRAVRIDTMSGSKTYGEIVEVIGKPSASGNYDLKNKGGMMEENFPHAWLRQPDGGIGFDSSGNIYIPSNGNNEVTVFSLNNREYIEGIESETKEAIKLLKPNAGFLGNEKNMVTRKGVSDFFGFSRFCRQLIVSDGRNNRLLVWNDYLSASDGALADSVITGDYLDGVTQQTVDVRNQLLYVASTNRIVVYKLPINYDEQPYLKIIDKLYWADNGKEMGSFNPMGIVYDKTSDALWISDHNGNKVLRVREMMSDKPYVDVVLGQGTKIGEWCNEVDQFDRRYPSDENSKYHKFVSIPQKNTLCNPGTLNIDSNGILFVVDGFYDVGFGNKRIIAFKLDRFNSIEAGKIIYAPDFDYVYTGTKTSEEEFRENYVKADTKDIPFYECEEHWPCIPVYASFVSDDMYVTVDSYGNPQGERLFVYRNYLEKYEKYRKKEIMPEVINLPLGQGAFHTFDEQGNFILQDHTWNSLLIFQKLNLLPRESASNIKNVLFS